MRHPIVVGNWKMNGSRTLAKDFASSASTMKSTYVDIVICPPACFLNTFDDTQIKLGAQTLSDHDNGAYTGDISASMLKECGCEYVIVGHSERREYHYETNTVVAFQAKKALSSGLIPIICIGESLETRQSGQLESFLESQLIALTDTLTVEELSRSIIAYEPIWAIGTGETATPEQAQGVHFFIRAFLAAHDESMSQKIRLLYGGSVKAGNAADLFAKPDIDGGLVGGASLDVLEFKRICQAAI